jgi:hypothetical protein
MPVVLFRSFRALIEYPLHRAAHLFICPVNTADPAARPAHAFEKFRDNSFYVIFSRCLLLDRDRPADPFVARERCEILPYRERLRLRNERFLEIGRQCVYGSRGNFHGAIVSQSSMKNSCSILFDEAKSDIADRVFGTRFEAFCKKKKRSSTGITAILSIERVLFLPVAFDELAHRNSG